MLKRSARHLLDPRVPLYRGIALCRMLQLHPLRRPLSQGDRLFDLLSSSSSSSSKLAMLHHISCSRPALGQIFSKPLALTTTIVVSSVGARITLPKCARKRDKIRGRLLAEMIKTRARSKLFKSGRADLTSPTLLNFPKEHRLCRVHSL